MLKNILFDLDGTLLPMEQDNFVNYYFSFLCRRMSALGFEPKELVKNIWAGTAAMVKNDGSRTNEAAFADYFCRAYNLKWEDVQGEFLDFYATEFNKAIAATSPSPYARRVIDASHKRGLGVYLATNPIFPAVATLNRIRWAGLEPEDFLDITTYEDCRYSKPNPLYFSELCRKHGLEPAECMMVGNDIEEDLAAAKLGMETYIVTGTIENKKNLPNTADHTGTLEELEKFILDM